MRGTRSGIQLCSLSGMKMEHELSITAPDQQKKDRRGYADPFLKF